SPVRLLEVRSVPDNAAEAATAALRAAVVRGMAAYFSAVGASVPLVELQRGGWTSQSALTTASGDIARAQQEAIAQGGWPFAQLAAVDTHEIRLSDGLTARVGTTVVGQAGLTRPNGQLLARQRVSWVTECSLVYEQGEWRMSAIRRLSQTELPDTGAG